MRELSKRIGIDPDFYQDYGYETKNESVHVRNLFLHRLILRVRNTIPPGALKRFLRSVYRTSAYRRTRADASHYQLTLKDRKTLEALDRHFLPFNQRLAETLDINLNVWK